MSLGSPQAENQVTTQHALYPRNTILVIQSSWAPYFHTLVCEYYLYIAQMPIKLLPQRKDEFSLEL